MDVDDGCRVGVVVKRSTCTPGMRERKRIFFGTRWRAAVVRRRLISQCGKMQQAARWTAEAQTSAEARDVSRAGFAAEQPGEPVM